MRTAMTAAVVAVALSGCGSTASTSSSGLHATPSHSVLPVATVRATKGPKPVKTKAHATVTVNPTYLSFVRLLCRAMSSHDSTTVATHLMHYEYNSGLRWGMFGDGEGHTADPSQMSVWLSGSRVHCRAFSPSMGGHGTLLTAGWSQPGPWSLLDLDLLNGQWTINDFTFGSRAVLARTMHQVAQPVIHYRG